MWTSRNLTLSLSKCSSDLRAEATWKAFFVALPSSSAYLHGRILLIQEAPPIKSPIIHKKECTHIHRFWLVSECSKPRGKLRALPHSWRECFPHWCFCECELDLEVLWTWASRGTHFMDAMWRHYTVELFFWIENCGEEDYVSSTGVNWVAPNSFNSSSLKPHSLSLGGIVEQQKKEGEQVQKNPLYWWHVFQRDRYYGWGSIFNSMVVRPKHPVSLQGSGWVRSPRSVERRREYLYEGLEVQRRRTDQTWKQLDLLGYVCACTSWGIRQRKESDSVCRPEFCLFIMTCMSSYTTVFY